MNCPEILRQEVDAAPNDALARESARVPGAVSASVAP